MKEDYILVRDKKHPVCIHYEQRRTSRVSIGKKAVYIRIPQHLPLHEKEKHIRQFKAWAYEKLLTHKAFTEKADAKTYADGDVLRIRDESYIIRMAFKDKKSSSARIVGREVRLSLSSGLSRDQLKEHVSVLLNRCFAKKMLPDLRKRVSELNALHFGFNVGRVLWKNTKSRWGSCSAAGNLNFSTRLLLAPRDVADYVIVHELAHLKQANHSKRFWDLVTKKMPSWREKRKWLRDHQNSCRL
jgi:predicted metal-dependent hydrolase